MESLVGHNVLVTTVTGDVHAGRFMYITKDHLQIKKSGETIYISRDEAVSIEPAEQLFDGIILIGK
jgi:hypothetical protein